MAGLRYLDHFERRGGEWRIVDRVVSYEWKRSRPILGRSFGAGYAVGRRDGSDPVLRPLVPSARPAPTPQALQHMVDRAAIYSQLVRYCRAVDRGDEELLRSVYHPDAHDDHGAYSGGVDGFVEFVKRDVQDRFRCTMHKLGQTKIEIDGDIAHCESYAIGHHVRAKNGRDVDDFVMGLRYVDRFERRGGEWRIADRQLRYEWQRRDPLRQLDSNWTLGRRGRSDPVWAR